MIVREHEPLAVHTTFRIGGPARFYIEATAAELSAVRALAAREQLPVRMLGGGANLLVPDAGIAAVVVKLAGQDISFDEQGTEATLVAEAGASWDAVVTAAATRSYFGLENLAGIPGTLGGAVVQNIGAYGAELREAFLWADVFNFATGLEERVQKNEAAFAYRDSRFKHDLTRVIVRAAFVLSRQGAPRLAYPDLARLVDEGRVLETPLQIAEAVRGIRAGKFPDLAEWGTAGSFFKNPILSREAADALAARFPGLPQFSVAEGKVKVPLAWILDKALQLRGYEKGAARLFERQPLVLVARAGARAEDVDVLAKEVALRVQEATGIVLEREVETFCAE